VPRAARASVPLGGLAGLGLSTVAIPDVGLTALTALAVAGALGGFMVGGMTGAIKRTRWDRDPAGFLEVPPGSHYTLVIVSASPAPARRETARVMGILVRARRASVPGPNRVLRGRRSQTSELRTQKLRADARSQAMRICGGDEFV
jgi:hypothetical protein